MQVPNAASAKILRAKSSKASRSGCIRRAPLTAQISDYVPVIAWMWTLALLAHGASAARVAASAPNLRLITTARR
jgi:hypothetical protein